MDTIVAQLKALHANVTRAHYLLNPGLLERFDRAGILVWSQAPIYHRDALLVTPTQRAEALSTLRGTVLAARSHPSVLTHSVANELSPAPDQLPTTRDDLLSAAQTVRSIDPTVPVALDLLSYPGYPRQHAYDAFQLLGINNYFGWYAGKPDHSTARLTDLGPYLKRMHSLYPDQAMVMTEFGAEADINGPASVKQTYAFQSDYIQSTLGILQSLPFMSGAIYWTLREFAVKPNWDGGSGRVDVPRNSIHHKGLISYGGQLKPAWSTAGQLFAATPLYPATFPIPAAPAPGPGDILVLGAILAALGLLVGLSVWGFLGIRAAHREPPPETLLAWRLTPSETAGQPDTTYA
jgi:beta-glucuronidase